MTPKQWGIVGGAVAGAALLTAAQAGAMVLSPEAMTAILTTSGVGAGTLVMRSFWMKMNRMADQFADVLSALHGPKDGNGKHRGGGVVERCDRIPNIEHSIDTLTRTVEDAALQASQAVSVTRELQKALVKLKDEK